MYIETERIILRPYSEADFEDYFAYIMEPELQHMLGLNGVTDRNSAYAAFQWLMEKREFLAIIEREQSRAIGHICLHPPYEKIAADPVFAGKRGISLSFALAKEYRKKGLMTEALTALIEHIFLTNKADFIDCEYTSFNTASEAVQRKLGFEYYCTEQLDGVTLISNILTSNKYR